MDSRWDDATRDRATGLPNAAIFRDRLARALEHGRRRSQGVCVILAGVASADSEEVARAGHRLNGAIRASDTVARFGGSDLALILPGLGEHADLAGVVERLRQSARGELRRIGVALAPADAEDVDSLLVVAQRRRDDSGSLLAG